MSETKIRLPVRPRNYRFALTPLADAMFQLLIFFMLTASLTPYSLLPLQNGTAPDTPGGAQASAAAAAPAPTAADVAIWTLEAGRILVGGQAFGFDELDGLAERLGREDGPAEVVLIVRETARVQDVATVLARLSTADIRSVRISEGTV